MVGGRLTFPDNSLKEMVTHLKSSLESGASMRAFGDAATLCHVVSFRRRDCGRREKITFGHLVARLEEPTKLWDRYVSLIALQKHAYCTAFGQFGHVAKDLILNGLWPNGRWRMRGPTKALLDSVLCLCLSFSCPLRIYLEGIQCHVLPRLALANKAAHFLP